MTGTAADVLPHGVDVPFHDIEPMLARLMRSGRRRGRRVPARARTATVVVIGTLPQLAAAADALDHLGDAGGVRAVLISEAGPPSATARVTEHAIALSGLVPRFVDNAVAALRLSNLPTIVWWRGGSLDTLESLAALADRLVLDVEEPEEVWHRALAHVERTALTAVRWTRLTRWRALLAHLFDVPDVAAASGEFTKLTIEAGDVPAARLFGAWLRTTLHWTPRTAIEIRAAQSDGVAPMENATLTGPQGLEVSIRVLPSRTCLEASLRGASMEPMSRVVPLGDTSLAALIGEELGVRARDVAFERALASALETSA